MKYEFWGAFLGTFVMSTICMYVSYETMYQVALDYGIKAAGQFPLIIDGTLVLSMFIRLYFSKIGKECIEPFLILVFFTLTSIIVNGIAAKGQFIDTYIYCLAPIGVLACTEMCARVMEKKPVEKKTTRRSTRGPNGQFIKKVD